jgi:hypothetical protein
MQPTLSSACRAAAQFNKAIGADGAARQDQYAEFSSATAQYASLGQSRSISAMVVVK